MVGGNVCEQEVGKCFWKGPIRVVSNSVSILAEYIEHILVVSQHKEQTLDAFECVTKMIGGLSLEDPFMICQDQIWILIFFNHIVECLSFIHVLEDLDIVFEA